MQDQVANQGPRRTLTVRGRGTASAEPDSWLFTTEDRSPVIPPGSCAELSDRQEQYVFQLDESGWDMGLLEFGASDVCSGAEMKVWGGDRASPIGMPLIGDDLSSFVVQQ